MRKEPAEYLSNWFPITLPRHIYFHALSRQTIGKLQVATTLPYPAVHDGNLLITFAEASDFEGKLGPEMYIAKAGEPLDYQNYLRSQIPRLRSTSSRFCALPGNKC